MAIRGTVGGIEPRTRLGQQGLDGFPYPLGPITDDAPAPLVFWNQAGRFARREGRAEWLGAWPLLPPAPPDDALPLPQREAHPCRRPPPSPPPVPPWPGCGLGPPRGPGPGRG